MKLEKNDIDQIRSSLNANLSTKSNNNNGTAKTNNTTSNPIHTVSTAVTKQLAKPIATHKESSPIHKVQRSLKKAETSVAEVSNFVPKCSKLTKEEKNK
jgi:hypothetical protein